MAKSLKFKSLTSLLSQVIQFLSGLVITPFVVKNLGEDFFSLWVVFLSLVSFEGFLLVGTPQSMNRFVPFYLGKNDEVSLSSLIRGQVIFSIIIYLLIIGGVGLFSENLFSYFQISQDFFEIFNWSIWVVMIGLGFSVLNKILISINNGQEKYTYYNSLLSIAVIVRLALILVFIDNGFSIMPIAYACGQAILFLGLFFSYLRGPISFFSQFNLSNDWKVFKLSFAFGAASMLMYVADILRHQLDTFLILKFVGLTEITHYKVGITLITSVNALNAGIFTVILTRLSFHQGAKEEEKFKDLSLRSFFYSSIFASYFILGISLLAPDFLKIWMGNYDNSSLQIIYILLIPQLLMLTQFPSINVMYSLNKQKIMGIMTLIESFINFGASVALVGKVGIIGVVIGTAVGFILSKGIVLPFVLRHYCALPLKSQVMQIFPQYFCGLITFLPLYFFMSQWRLDYEIVDFLIKCFLISVFYFGALKIFYSLFPKEEAGIFSLSGIRSIFR